MKHSLTSSVDTLAEDRQKLLELVHAMHSQRASADSAGLAALQEDTTQKVLRLLNIPAPNNIESRQRLDTLVLTATAGKSRVKRGMSHEASDQMSNQHLEFLGDAVLKFATWYIFTKIFGLGLD